MATNEENIRKALETDRIISLTDGIFAFSMTLLIIGIAIPEIPKALAPTQLWPKLSEMIPVIFDFILSFVLLAVFWNIHQKQFRAIKRADERLSWINIILLLAVVFMPFATELSSKYDNSIIAVAIFNIDLLVISLLYLAIWKYAQNVKLIDANLSAETINFIGSKYATIMIICLIALVLGLFIPAWCTVVYWAIPLILIYKERKHKISQ